MRYTHTTPYFGHQLHHASHLEQLRMTVQASLLAGLSYDKIAETNGLLSSSVEWYEKIHFNVADRLHQRGWIINQILGPAAGRGILYRTEDMTMKLFAYCGGPEVYEFVRTAFMNEPVPRTPAEVRTFISQHVSNGVGRRAAWEVSGHFTVNEFNITDLLNAHAKFLELEQELGAGQARNYIEANLQALLKNTRWSVGEKRISANDRIRGMDEGSLELYDEELMAVAAGNEPPKLTEEMTALAVYRSRTTHE
jgi:hypothetical protein